MAAVYVYCKVCEHQKNPNDCWCVIDTVKKTRHFECKVVCVKPAVIPEPSHEVRDPEDIQLEEWSSAYPRQTIVSRVLNWFSTPLGYTKVKTS